MQKKLTAAAIAGAVVLGGGAAIAVPAFGADSTSSPSATSDAKPANLTDAITKVLKGLVDDKTLTQAQADKVAETLGKPGALPGGGHGFGGHDGMGFGGLMKAEADAAAKVLGMSADDIRSALREGTTLAELAKKQGKSEDTLINALVAAAKTQLADAVKAGRLTQARADEIQKNLPDQVKQIVENGRGGFGPGMHGPRGFGKRDGGTAPTPGQKAPAPSGSGSSTNFVPSAPSV